MYEFDTSRHNPFLTVQGYPPAPVVDENERTPSHWGLPLSLNLLLSLTLHDDAFLEGPVR
ncbi:hypothetical protein D3C78_1720030 [compost metagenome]